MENSERQNGEESPVPAGRYANHDDARELNRRVETDPNASVWPIDGDAPARIAANDLQAHLARIIGVKLQPWQVTYLESLGKSPVTITGGRRGRLALVGTESAENAESLAKPIRGASINAAVFDEMSGND